MHVCIINQNASLRQVQICITISHMQEQEQAPKKKDGFFEMIRFILMAVAIVLPIRILVAQPFIVSGSSMIPTFENNEYLIVDQLTYRFDEPKRGDVIVFRFPLDTSKFFIKRVIGLPNETVSIKDGNVTITTVEDEEVILDEPYVNNIAKDTMSVTLKSNEYFVMGDNRLASSDSRSWGVLPKDKIMGKAFVRLLPVESIDFHPGEYRFE